MYWGDHVRAVRLERGLLQREAAEIIGIAKTNLVAWEKHEKEPRPSSLPGVISFLGYCPMAYPENEGQKIRLWRRLLGYGHRDFAKLVNLHPATVRRIELGRFKDAERYSQNISIIQETLRSLMLRNW